jgi:CBS domain-containing protein
MAQVRDVMTSNPVTCSSQASIADAAKVMAKEDIGPLPVVDADRLVGILTDRDIVVRVVAEGRDPQSTSVGDVATSDLVTVSPDEDLSRALQLLAERQVRRLPVAEGETLVGVIAQADIARQGDDSATGQVVEQISKSEVGPCCGGTSWFPRESLLRAELR